MSLRSLLTETVTIRNAPTVTDGYNNATLDWAHPTDVTSKARLEQTLGTEVTAGRDTAISDWLLVAPAGVPVTAFSRIVRADQTVFEVVGPPAIYDTPARMAHIEAHLRHVSG